MTSIEICTCGAIHVHGHESCGCAHCLTEAGIDTAGIAAAAKRSEVGSESAAVEVVTAEVPRITCPTTFRYRADFDPRSRAVRFGGPDRYYTAELLRGDLNGLIGHGLIALSRPSGHIGKVRRYSTWKVVVPKRTKRRPAPGLAAKLTARGDFRNIARLRRELHITGKEVAVFRFDRPVPKPLVFALKIIFEGATFPLIPAMLGFSLSGDDFERSDHEEDDEVQQSPHVGIEQEGRASA